MDARLSVVDAGIGVTKMQLHRMQRVSMSHELKKRFPALIRFRVSIAKQTVIVRKALHLATRLELPRQQEP